MAGGPESCTGGYLNREAVHPAYRLVSAWSPDGSTIALALFVSGHIAFVNRLGELQRRIALRETREWIRDLDWSASHDRLLLVADDAQKRPTSCASNRESSVSEAPPQTAENNEAEVAPPR